VPETSLGWWQERFQTLGIDTDAPRTRDEEEVLTLRDPDGLVIDLVASVGDQRSGWDGVAAIPTEHAVRGLHAITLSEEQLDPSATMLTDLLGMTLTGEDKGRSRFGMSDGGPGALVDVFSGVRDRGLQAGGTVHHVAFRAPDLETMTGWQHELMARGVQVTQILDRQYFKSIYFREPGGVLFEIATDAPGFAIDEPLLELGRHLKLPPWLEPTREQIAAALPPLQLDVDVP
jgi:glyoxalase family protein